MGLVIDVKQLDLGDELGRGGQAVVVALSGDRDDEVFKRYLPRITVDSDALDALIVWRHGLRDEDREFLDERACWPSQRVVDGDTTVGVVIRRAPVRFLEMNKDGKTFLRELQRLFLVERMRKLGADVPEPLDRLRVVAQLAELLEFLGRHDVVHGDLSMKNVLWERPVPGRPAVFLLDCDGARIGEQPAPLPAVTTPGWSDPRIGKGEIRVHDAQSDLYALTLSFYRCYYGHQGSLDEQSTTIRVPQWPPIDQNILQLTTDGLSHRDNRPAAAAWLTALQTLIAEIENPVSELSRQYRELRPAEEVRNMSAPVLADAGPPASGPAHKLVTPVGRNRSDSQWPVILAVAGGLAAGAVVAFVIITLFLTGS